MDDAAWMDLNHAGISRSIGLFGMGRPENRLLRMDGVVAAITPRCPERSIPNAVGYERADALIPRLDELAAAYEEAGVHAWTVWTRAGHDALKRAMAERGHVLDASPAGMVLELADLRDTTAPEPADWGTDWDLTGVGAVNDRAYGDEQDTFGAALGELPEGSARIYLARLDGRVASFVLVHDNGDDCVFAFAATLPEAQGHGLVSWLLHRALDDARERGQKTSTTQATKMGQPVYERLGFRAIEPVEMWERRV